MNARLGDIVIYRSRTGDYSCAAVVTATQQDLHMPNVEAGYIAGLTSETHVHLSVLTPGKPGKRAEATDFKVESEHPRQENVGGMYQEWDIPYDEQGSPGTWRHKNQITEWTEPEVGPGVTESL